MKKVLLFMFCLIFLFVGVCFSADKTVSLQWDQNSDAQYYIVYQSIASGDYVGATETRVNVPLTTVDILLENVVEEQTYYFAIKAFNDCGNSSDFSEEVFVKYGTRVPEAPTGVKAWWKKLIVWLQGLFASVG